MILDKYSEFADNAAVGANTGARVVGNVVDLGANQNRNIGAGEPLYLVIQASADFDDTTGATATVEFKLASDDAATLDGTITTHLTTGVIDPADGIAEGDVLAVVALPQHADYQRFLGILADVQGEAVTAGAINAFLTHDVANWKAYDAPFQS